MDDFLTGLKVVKFLLPIIIIILVIGAPFILIAMIVLPLVFAFSPSKTQEVETPQTVQAEYEEVMDDYNVESTLVNDSDISVFEDSEMICFGNDESGWVVVPSCYQKREDGTFETETEDFYIVISAVSFPKEDKSFDEWCDVIKQDMYSVVKEPIIDDIDLYVRENIYFELPRNFDDEVNHIVFQGDGDETDEYWFDDITETTDSIYIFKMCYMKKEGSDSNMFTYPDYLLELAEECPEFGYYQNNPGVVSETATDSQTNDETSSEDGEKGFGDILDSEDW